MEAKSAMTPNELDMLWDQDITQDLIGLLVKSLLDDCIDRPVDRVKLHRAGLILFYGPDGSSPAPTAKGGRVFREETGMLWDSYVKQFDKEAPNGSAS